MESPASKFTTKNILTATLAVSVLNLSVSGYVLYESKKDKPTPAQIVQQLRAQNQWSGEQLEEINKAIPTWAK